MRTTDALLARDLLEFVRDAHEEVTPWRETHRARRLRPGLFIATSRASIWSAVVSRLPPEANYLSQAVHFVALYLDPDPPGAPSSLAGELLSEILEAGKANVAQLLEAAGQSYFWDVLGCILPDLELATTDVVACARHAWPSGKLSSDSLRRWSRRNALASKLIVETHWEDLLVMGTSGHDSLAELVIGIAQAGEASTWRDGILRRLCDHPNQQVQGIGMRVACWAWELDAPAAVRHELLLELAEEAVGSRGIPALLTLRSDAFGNPKSAVETGLEIVNLVHRAKLRSDDAAAAATAFLAILGTACRQSKGQILSDIGVRDALSKVVVDSGPRDSHVGHELDAVLSAVLEVDEAWAFQLLSTWLSVHGRKIQISLSRAFTSTTHHAGPAVVGGWYVRWLTSTDCGLRMAAARWLSREDQPKLTKACVEALEDSCFRGLVWQLLGTPGFGAKDITSILFGLLASRVSESEFLTERLLEICRMYPGACGEEARRRISMEHDPAHEACRQVLELLDSRRMHLASVVNVPEVVATTLALAEYRILEGRVGADARRQAYQGSIVAMLASRQPIACGEGTFAANNPELRKFVPYEASFELSSVSAADPAMDAWFRVECLERAEHLLKLREVEEH